MNEGKIAAASVVREGGAAAAVCRMCFGKRLGFTFDKGVNENRLYSPAVGDLVLELACDPSELEDVEFITLGKTVNESVITVGEETFAVDDLISKWMSPLEDVFPTDPKAIITMDDVPVCHVRPSVSCARSHAKPAVFIPVFPGTNCENDSAAAFERAGAKVNMLVLRNLTSTDIEDSIRAMADMIDDSQMIMIPGGFSGGDEPDGSAKFIATTFRNPLIAGAVTELLDKRGGLILGICNGFQALVKLGLLPYGEIRDLTADMPTLTFNTLGRHVSRMVNTRITSVKSPWLALCDPGDVYTVPVSHGEGRFAASGEILRMLADNGQIATQYCDEYGTPSDDITWNPNGSMYAIEGITSADGRIFGKMGHSERCGENIAANIPGLKDMKIFAAGVEYFK